MARFAAILEPETLRALAGPLPEQRSESPPIPTEGGAAILGASSLGRSLPAAASSRGTHASVLVLGAGFAGASLGLGAEALGP